MNLENDILKHKILKVSTVKIIEGLEAEIIAAQKGIAYCEGMIIEASKNPGDLWAANEYKQVIETREAEIRSLQHRINYFKNL